MDPWTLTILVCLKSAPLCTPDNALDTSVFSSRGHFGQDCNTVATELLINVPPPEGTVARFICTNDEDSRI